MARIAVVDDEPHVRKLLEAMFRSKGHEVTSFPSGAEAMIPILGGAERETQEPTDPAFELVLSDVQMPRLDGISLCRALRERFSKAELPIILVSVLSSEDDILRAFDAGASDYVTKPFSTRVVRAKVELLLRPEHRPPTGAPRAVLRKDPKELPTPFDKYVLTERIGYGAFGTVYAAHRRLDQRPVAVKLIARHVNTDREALARLLREIQTLSRLDVPGVVGFLDSGYELGRYFVVMELVPGEAVEKILYDGPLPLPDALRIGRDVSRAIADMQQRDLVHRDIKPANIIFDQERATLIDLGLAKRWTEQGLTQSGFFMGTAEFLAPEIIQGRTTGSTSTDLYALGVTLYEVLTHRRAFGDRARVPFQILEEILNGPEPPRVDEYRPEVPPDFADLVAELMARDPRERLRDPSRAAERFEELLAAHAPSATPGDPPATNPY